MAGTNPGERFSAGVLQRAVFAAAGETFTWGDVVDAARLNGEWEAAERAARQGLASVPFVSPDPDELAEAETAFRRARNLLAGEETTAWLERWQITIGEWRDFLRLELARAYCGDGLDETLEPVPDETLWAEAVCSGTL